MSKKSYLSIYAKSFNWAGFFLPQHTYQNCSKLYSFCRILDNIADDQDTIASKEQKFKDFKQLYLKNTSSSSLVKSGSTISGVIDTTFLPFKILPVISVFSAVVKLSASNGLIDI